MIKNVKYAYAPSGVLTYKNDAVRGSEYFLDAGLTIGLTYAKGEQREYFKGAYNSDAMAEFKRINESIEHYNAKMKIVYDGGVTINGTFLKAIKVKDEVWIPSIKMQPDVVFLDESDKPYFIVEVKRSNAKSIEDINKLNTLNIPVYEKDINDNSRSEFICLGECDWSQEYKRAKRGNSEVREKLRAGQKFLQEQQNSHRRQQLELSKIESLRGQRLREENRELREAVESLECKIQRGRKTLRTLHKHRNKTLSYKQVEEAEETHRKHTQEIPELERLLALHTKHLEESEAENRRLEEQMFDLQDDIRRLGLIKKQEQIEAWEQESANRFNRVIKKSREENHDFWTSLRPK